MSLILRDAAPSARRSARSRGRNLLGLVGLVLMLLAIGRELRKPAAQRTWRGEVLGFVPYDLRPPTLARIRASLWQPDSSRWLLPRSVGVGWSPNVARFVGVLRRPPR